MASSSGLPEPGDLAPGAHVGLYRDQDDLLETLVPFFAAGLEQNERCIWVTSEPLCAADARAALAAVVLDLACRERAGQIDVIDESAWRARSGSLGPGEVIEGWLAAEEQALRDGYRGLRVSTNTYGLAGARWQASAAYEAKAHIAFAQRNIVALSSYSLAGRDSCDDVDVPRGDAASDDSETARLRVELAEARTALASEVGRRQIIEAAYDSVRNRREHLVQLERVAAALGEVTTRLDLAEVITNLVAPTLDTDGIVIVEHRDDGEQPTLVGDGLGVDELRTLATTVADRTVWSADAAVLGTTSPLRAAAAIPLYASGLRLGTCVLGFATPRPLSATYRALVQDVVRQLALALERSKTYERLEHERERAELASRAKDEFLAMLGHELRNPLSPILTATQLMRMRTGETHDRERTVIERQVKHMIRLVDDLLDVSRITRGKVDLRRRAVELKEIIVQAAELSSPALEERMHRFTVDAQDSGIIVHADPQRLTQVLSNLITNAAKYTPTGGDIRLSVKAAQSMVTISVRDNGIGIDPKLLPNIFDLFVQGRQGIDRASGGLGLGLAIARSLCEMHGGTIRARSEGIGKGSELVIELPRFANTRPSVRNSVSGTFPLPTTRGRRVLVVDDNEDAAFLFSEALKRLGHHVEVAYDGPSALVSARERPPEIAFLDIGLPVMDGYELARRLRELGDTPPRLVAVTGYGHASDKERSRDAGFDLHLVKPIELNAVQDALAKLV